MLDVFTIFALGLLAGGLLATGWRALLLGLGLAALGLLQAVRLLRPDGRWFP